VLGRLSVIDLGASARTAVEVTSTVDTARSSRSPRPCALSAPLAPARCRHGPIVEVASTVRAVCAARSGSMPTPPDRRGRLDRARCLRRPLRLDADTARAEACGEDHSEAKWSLERETSSS